MRQRETTLRLKLATRRTTTARLIDARPREYGAREAEMVTLPERRRTLSHGLHGARPRILSILFESALPRSTLLPDGKLAAPTLRHR